MDQQLKQRLIGTTLVVSLIVIFVPLFFEDRDSPGSAGQSLDMTQLPGTLEERPVELPGGSGDIAETGKTDTAPAAGGYRIVPLNDPPPRSATRSTPPGGRELTTPEAGTDEEFTIVDEGASREQDVAPAKPANKKVTVYPLEPREPVQLPPPTRSKPVYPVDPPLTVKPTPPRAPAVDAGNKPPGGEGNWVIQAGSFTGEANARNLVDKLRKSNFPAFVEVIPGESGTTMYRVRVGPELGKARADQVKARIETAVGIKGIVIPVQ